MPTSRFLCLPFHANERERLALIQNLKKTRLGNPQPWLRELSDKGESVYQQICEARIEDVEGILDEYLGAPLEESLGESSQQQQKSPPSQQGVHMGELRIIIKSLGDRDQNCDSDSDSDWKKALKVFEFARKRPEFEHEGKGMLSAILKILGKQSQLVIASNLFNELEKDGYLLDVYAYTAPLSAYSQCGKSQKAT